MTAALKIFDERKADVAPRARPAWLRALGDADPPLEITVDRIAYRRLEIFKHDSWAATALYTARGRLIVAKFNRRQTLLGLPGAWVGRRLARREAKFLRRLSTSGFVPQVLGPVYVDGSRARHALARTYIEGSPLGRDVPLRDDFFARLRTAVLEIHRRGMAYVDLHKRENILVGRDGLPYLIDYQASFGPSAALIGAVPFVAWFLGILQSMDLYHLTKLHRKFRPDQCPLSREELAALRPGFVRLHRFVAQPLRTARRRLLNWIGVRGVGGRAESEQFTEAALRHTVPSVFAAGANCARLERAA